MEVIYWWPPCLFSLPLLLVLLSTLLSYLAVEGCLCMCICVCVCVGVKVYMFHPCTNLQRAMRANVSYLQ